MSVTEIAETESEGDRWGTHSLLASQRLPSVCRADAIATLGSQDKMKVAITGASLHESNSIVLQVVDLEQSFSQDLVLAHPSDE